MKLFPNPPAISAWHRRHLGAALGNEQTLAKFIGFQNSKVQPSVETLRRFILLEVEGKCRPRILHILIVRMQKLERKELEKKIAKRLPQS